MATTKDTLKSLEMCNRLISEVLELPREDLPSSIRQTIVDIEQEEGDLMEGHNNTLALHIGQQRRQLR